MSALSVVSSLKRPIAALAAVAVLAVIPAAHAQLGAAGVDPARAAAIHQCSVLAQRYPETTFASLEFQVYRACMARHGQIE